MKRGLNPISPQFFICAYRQGCAQGRKHQFKILPFQNVMQCLREGPSSRLDFYALKVSRLKSNLHP